MEGDLKMDILKGKRYDIMNVLWEEGRPLSAFEINDIAPELKMPTVRRCLELLLKENLIQVAGTSMNGKVYARNYTPLLSREDYLKGNAKSRKINPVEINLLRIRNLFFQKFIHLFLCIWTIPIIILII